MKRRLGFAALVAAALSVAPAVARDCSGTLTTGGAAQNAISTPGVNGIHGYTICNLSTSAVLWFNPNATASAGPGSIPLPATTATT